MQKSLNLCSLFDEGCAKNNQNIAVCMLTEKELLNTTYSKLSELSKVIASVLRQYSCIGKFIGIIASPSIHIPAIILGILNAPACFVPVDLLPDTALNSLGIDYMICTNRDSRIILERFHMKHVESPALVPYQLVLMMRTTNITQLESKHNCQIAYAMHTSGSTGTPKVVRVPHKCIVPNIMSLRSKLNVSSQDVVFMASPLTFDASIVEMFLALSTGATLFMVSMTTKLMPRKLAKVLQDNSVTIIQATPSLIFRFGPDLLKKTILSRSTKLRALILGGEPCPVPAVIAEWKEEGNTTEIWNIYGITEVSSWATLYKIAEKDIKNKVNKSVPLGEPLDGTVLQVRNDRGQAITSGKGQLYIGGEERVCLLNDEDVIIPRTMRATGDIVELSPEGLLYIGRKDHQIKRNGQRINLSQLSEAVSSVSLFTSSCILQEPSTNKLLLFVIPNTSKAQPSVDSVYQELEKALPRNCIPDAIHILDELPMTKHGKVDTKKLLAQREVARSGVAGETISDEELRKIWKDVLQIKSEINDDSNFILLGGDSFQAIRLLNQIELVTRQSVPDLLDYILHNKYHEIFELIKKNVSKKTTCKLLTNHSAAEKGCSVLHGLFSDNVQDKLLNPDTENKNNLKTTCKVTTNQNAEATGCLISHGLLSDTVPDKLKNLDTENERKRSMSSVTDNLNKSKQLKTDNTIASNSCTFSDDKKVCRGSQRIVQYTDKIILECNNRTRKRSQGTVSIKERWKYDTAKCIDASPLLVYKDGDNGVVYIGSHSHKFQAVLFDTGLLLWTRMLGDRIESSACLSKCGNYVIVGCYDHNVYVLNAENGGIFWTWETGGPVKSSPIVHLHTGIVFIGSHDQCIHALDIENKNCLFSTHCGGGSVFSSPCIDVAMDTVYVGTLNGKLMSINCISGKVKWKNNIGKPIFSSPSVTKEGVVVGCVDNNLYHISSSNEMLWSFETSAPIFSSPCVSNTHQSTTELTVIGSHDSYIYCIHTLTGKEVWKFKTPSPVYATPFIFQSDILQSEGGNNHFVVCSCTQGFIFVLSLSGQLVLSWELNGDIFSSPIAHDNNIIVGCRDDNIYNLQFVNDN
ncbi:beta-alanine-activating enzyme-like [Antedon mediterranea]|uniref:beta-alanine-activating enzyme-like n=1 Tax=Antedon mediterranea TaxID=105859 RepID=UPI003AF62A22